MYLDNLLSF